MHHGTIKGDPNLDRLYAQGRQCGHVDGGRERERKIFLEPFYMLVVELSPLIQHLLI